MNYAEVEVRRCKACERCMDVCPKKISIPDLFADMNALNTFQTWNSRWYYSIHTKNSGKASDCIKCGKCEAACPQHLPIRELLEKEIAQNHYGSH